MCPKHWQLIFSIYFRNTIVPNEVVPKKVDEKFSFSKLIKKVKFLLRANQSFCIIVFNVGGCIANCLTFRPFLTLNP